MAQATTNESPSPLVLQAQTRIGRVRAIEPNTESVLLQMVDEQSGVVVDYWVSVDLLRYPEVDGMQNGQAGAEDVVANGTEALSLLTARLSHVMQLYAGLALQRMLVVPVFRPLLIAAQPDESNRIALPNSNAVEQDLINTWQWLEPALIENIDVSSVLTATLGQSIPTGTFAYHFLCFILTVFIFMMNFTFQLPLTSRVCDDCYCRTLVELLCRTSPFPPFVSMFAVPLCR
jgi:hypothetical protein